MVDGQAAHAIERLAHSDEQVEPPNASHISRRQDAPHQKCVKMRTISRAAGGRAACACWTAGVGMLFGRQVIGRTINAVAGHPGV
jgi:hypothetical protein